MPQLAIPLAGRRFLNLTVLDRAPKSHRSCAMWNCRCDCGRRQIRKSSTLLHNLPHRDLFPCACQEKILLCQRSGCSNTFIFNQKTPQHYCSKACANKVHNYHELKHRTCSECGIPFPAKGNGRSFRCESCRAKKPYPGKPRPCQRPGCTNTFISRKRSDLVYASRTSAVRRYCSKACRRLDYVRIYSSQTKGFSREQRFLAGVLVGYVHKVNRHQKAVERKAWLKTEEGRKWRNNDAAEWMRRKKGRALETVECKTCGTSFQQDRIGRKHCVECRQTDRVRRVWHERVNPTIVFERDSWTCQHCKKPAPERLRGTLTALAPELDHILPVAFGGAHSYFNTQCLCRLCNSKKGEHVEREPKLCGVTDLSPYKTAKYPPTVGERKEMLCACGCGELFTPSHSNLTGCKHGHWQFTEEAQRTRCGNDSSQYAGHALRIGKALYEAQFAMKQRQGVESAFSKRMQSIKPTKTVE